MLILKIKQYEALKNRRTTKENTVAPSIGYSTNVNTFFSNFSLLFWLSNLCLLINNKNRHIDTLQISKERSFAMGSKMLLLSTLLIE